VIDQYARLNEQLSGRQVETEERRYQNNRAIEATGNARGAYIERLRYTIKTYSKNIKELGELAEYRSRPTRCAWRTTTCSWRRPACTCASSSTARASSA
jgi:hypothetical protein